MKPIYDEVIITMLKNALADYGADYGPEGIERGDKRCGVYATATNGRLQFRRAPSGDLLYSGPLCSNAVHRFVQRYWYWKPTTGDHHD